MNMCVGWCTMKHRLVEAALVLVLTLVRKQREKIQTEYALLYGCIMIMLTTWTFI
ncbi:hypothetical protein DEO72_LG6g661 [Vigna unguiculata]|uniref:Uncharacterized protein n=1 Tax=Vigna unguiculata TaxID=3917 RepID=A0A4D6M5C6_VIGUN|nr:hypothetical protein DEO72_LG6g661 [Vigna unguiculata]